MSTPTTARPGDDKRDQENSGDGQQEMTAEQAKLSRQRSFTLLRDLLRPVKGQFVLMAVMVIVAQAAVVAGPAIIAWGIDAGLPALLEGDGTKAWYEAIVFPTQAAAIAYIEQYFSAVGV